MKLFEPLLAGGSLRERLLACLGALVGIALTFMLCGSLPIAIVAPIGASAVLVFAVPASPLAQPWSVVGGNTLSALTGIAAFRLVPDAPLAAGLAVGGAILVMSLCRCLHPPGGAAALTAVIGGPAVHAAGFGFALLPVALNSVVLVLLGIACHRLTRRAYPHRPVATPAPGLHLADIDAALADMDETFDIDRADLDALLTRAESHAAARHLRATTAAARRPLSSLLTRRTG